MMNGMRSTGSGEVKYPANCAARISVDTNAAASLAAADGTVDTTILDRMYEPKPNKKVMRVVTVIGYIFTVSMVAILLSLYYLFLWNPYIKHHEKTMAEQGQVVGHKIVSDHTVSPDRSALSPTSPSIVLSAFKKFAKRAADHRIPDTI